ncbi:carboxymuconolactone decarboxylase family protein [Ramlibacter sp. XY19]|uniref:carboxymuconolactone decarboxylase family protein n=1 Tax=Ramlibacter paludis TaxID=2908000 RepID=UPI0023DA65F3|nr:carboxymuconolactone decarboxylase family protein [Ramlibacter paludis]MCG2594769.1 carboxymuconolactone decarboxylase family protein [Ramlibacter paludis]
METARLNQPQRLAAEAYQGLAAVSGILKSSNLGAALIALVDIRVSQINGCAFCLDMHARELLAAETPDLQRLNSLATWRECSFYTERERAALQWAESLTLVSETGAPKEDFEALRAHFSDREIAELTLAVGVINAWNRFAVGLRLPVARKALVR